MEHTKGPWRELAPGVIAAVHRDPGWGAIAKVAQADTEPEAQANARLIASAPTLLEALGWAIRELENAANSRQEKLADWVNRLDFSELERARDAIEAARGNTS